MWFTHLLGLYATINSNEDLTHTTTWINHEFKMLAHLRGIYQAEQCEELPWPAEQEGVLLDCSDGSTGQTEVRVAQAAEGAKHN